MTGCFYSGIQQHGEERLRWIQANIISRYYLTSTVSATVRFEYFNDRDGAILVPVTNADHYETTGVSAGLNVDIDTNVLFRVEAKQFFSHQHIYLDGMTPSKTSLILTASLCAWF